MSTMSNLAIDVEYALVDVLTVRRDEACQCGDADLRNGLYRSSNASYMAAARWARAIRNIQQGRPPHREDLATVTYLRTRIEQQLLDITREAVK